jgi:hypothetical protein
MGAYACMTYCISHPRTRLVLEADYFRPARRWLNLNHNGLAPLQRKVQKLLSRGADPLPRAGSWSGTLAADRIQALCP